MLDRVKLCKASFMQTNGVNSEPYKKSKSHNLHNFVLEILAKSGNRNFRPPSLGLPPIAFLAKIKNRLRKEELDSFFI